MEKLAEDKTKLKEEVAAKETELKSRSLQNAKQVKLLKDKCKKLEIAASQSNNREKLVTITNQQIQSKNKQLESDNNQKNKIIKTFKNKLTDIKTMKANNMAIRDEDLFEDKLEKILYESVEKKNKTLMLTYVAPGLKVEVDKYFLQKQSEEKEERKTLKQIHIETKPLMVTYLWPLGLFQSKVSTEAITNRGIKRTKSQEYFQSKRIKADESNLDENYLDLHQVSFKRKLESVNESDNKRRKGFEENNFIPSICYDIINQSVDCIETPEQEMDVGPISSPE